MRQGRERICIANVSVVHEYLSIGQFSGLLVLFLFAYYSRVFWSPCQPVEAHKSNTSIDSFVP